MAEIQYLDEQGRVECIVTYYPTRRLFVNGHYVFFTWSPFYGPTFYLDADGQVDANVYRIPQSWWDAVSRWSKRMDLLGCKP
jgi:hypothetical protein